MHCSLKSLPTGQRRKRTRRRPGNVSKGTLFYLLHATNRQTSFKASFPEQPWVTGTRNAKPIWILLKQEMMQEAVASTGPYADHLHLAPEPHHSIFYRPDSLPDAQLTVSKH